MKNGTAKNPAGQNGSRKAGMPAGQNLPSVGGDGTREPNGAADMQEAKEIARARKRVWMIVIGYALCSVAWICLSDRVLAALVADPEKLVQWSIGKGIFFILVTTALLYLLMSRLVLLIARGSISYRKAEKGVRERESLFKAVVENMPFEFWMRDMEGRCIVENPLLVRRCGSLLGKKLDDMAGSGGELAAWKANHRLAYDGKVYYGALEAVDAGEKRFFKNIIAPIRTSDGMRGILGFNIDITENKRAEKAIGESEAKYRNYINGSPVAILVFDPDGRCMEVNPAACALCGKTEEELTRMNARDILSPESLESARKHFEQFRKKGRVSFDLEYRRKDGNLVHVALNAITLSEDRYIAFCQDITERKRTHNALRASELQYRSTIDSMKEAIHMVDPDLKLLMVNKTLHQWSKKLGITPAKPGQHISEAFAFLSEKTYDEYRRVFETGMVVSTTERNVFNGNIVDTETIKIPIIENGRTVRVVTVIRDVTEEKRIESQVLRAQRMECIGSLASGVAHDLNNVLSPIMMGASMLHDPLPAEIHERMVTTIEEAARRGADIVKQVLTFARGVEGERLVLHPGLLIREMEKIVRETFPKSITVSSRKSDALWNIEGDSTQLHQVLLNLCVNARDAMPDGGYLTLYAENVVLDASSAERTPDAEAGHYVEFNVKDTGMGIPPEIQDKIFDPFFTTKKQGLGTGLGLSMVIGIAKSHGGFVTVESEPGCGAGFKVFIPAVSPDAYSAGSATVGEQGAPRGNGELILLVDDEEAILVMAEATLKKHGYNVACAHDGVEAVSLYALHKESVRLVITDIMMPFVDGVALVRALKNMNPAIRIIASTGQAEKSRQNDLRAQGIETFLFKPYDVNRLLTAVHEELKGVG